MGLGDFAPGVDQIGNSFRRAVLDRFRRSVSNSNLPAGVGNERIGKLEFLSERATRLRVVEAASDDVGIE